jgi:hypothetical protein
MHGGNGVPVDSSDEDGDDDEDDEFEDSEQTEATATGTDVEGSITSEGELCATPDSVPRAIDKWVTVKGQALPPSPQSSPVVIHEAVPVVAHS